MWTMVDEGGRDLAEHCYLLRDEKNRYHSVVRMS